MVCGAARLVLGGVKRAESPRYPRSGIEFALDGMKRSSCGSTRQAGAVHGVVPESSLKYIPEGLSQLDFARKSTGEKNKCFATHEPLEREEPVQDMSCRTGALTPGRRHFVRYYASRGVLPDEA